MNLFTLLHQATERFADRPAVYVGAEPRLTFAELRMRALRLARDFLHHHATGERIAIVSENCPEYIETAFAVWAAGMVLVPINAKLHAEEICYILRDAEVSRCLVSAKLLTSLQDLISTRVQGCRVTALGGRDYEAALGGDYTEPVDVAPDSLAWLFYTSGTTGRPKGAMLSHRNLLAMTVGHLADIDAVDEECSLIHAAPMSHGSGLYMLPYVARAARQVIPVSRGFDPVELLELCEQLPAVSCFLAPTMLQRLRSAATKRGRRPANLRMIVYGGGPMYVPELRKALVTFGNVFAQIYGQGEAPMTITALARADHESSDADVLGSVGWARTGTEVRVVSPRGERLPVGETGEIICRGDVVMSGYWRNPAASAETLRDGWLYTGDLGSLDTRGRLTLRDRSKDLIISGGSNIYPREVEEALISHPAVLEVSVVGEPDAEWGENIVAFVVTAAGSRPDSTDLDAHCLARIARFKRPKRYVFLDALPKNSYGKILKSELRRMLSVRERMR